MQEPSEAIAAESEVEAGVVETPKPVEANETKSTFIDFEDPQSFTKDNVQSRFGELTRKNHETSAEAKKIRDENARLAKQVAELSKPKEVAAPNPDDAAIDPEQFGRDLEAHQNFVKNQAQFDADEKHRQGLAVTQEQERVQNDQAEFNQRAANAGLDIPKANQALKVVAASFNQAENRALAEMVGQEILGHKKSAEIMVHLAENPMELYELTGSTISQAIRKLDAITNKLSPKKIIPEPPEALSGGSGAVTSEYGQMLD